jgi:hypothetical protein
MSFVLLPIQNVQAMDEYGNVVKEGKKIKL